METIKQEAKRQVHYLSTNIRVLRKRMRLSQEELAQSLGLNRGNIASYENGTAEPKISNLLNMAQFFGVSLIDLAQYDLSNEHVMASLSRIQGLCPKERSKLQKLYEAAQSFDDFLNGIQSCFLFKAKDLDQYENLPPNIDFLKSHFEQLHAASSKLINQHRELLLMCKSKDNE